MTTTDSERNFRSSYYEKVGCYSVEEKKSLNKLLQDDIRNHAKLKQFCLCYTVPTTERTLLWSIILGVSPIHKNSETYFREQRHAIYEDLIRAVTIMQYIDVNTPKSRILHAMWQCENNKILYPAAGKPEDDHCFVEIVKVLLQIFDNDVDTYWIAKEFYLCTKDIKNDLIKLKELTLLVLKREDIALHNHLEKLGVCVSNSRNDILDKWYICCFAGAIRETALVKVWDKICGGSRKIVVFVFIELIKTFRETILRINTAKELKAIIEQVKDQDATIINKAIKSWQNNKNHSEIAVH